MLPHKVAGLQHKTLITPKIKKKKKRGGGVKGVERERERERESEPVQNNIVVRKFKICRKEAPVFSKQGKMLKSTVV
jgi:hypothetical protein